MSVYEAKSKFLSLGSKVWREGSILCCRTNLVWRLLSLLSFDRQVQVDPGLERISVRTRKLWFLGGFELIPFSRVSHIDYDYSSMATSFAGWMGGGEAADKLESYKVSLVLDDGRQVPVGAFRGEGSAMTGWTGVVLGDSIVDAAGNQDDTSRAFVEQLQEILGVPLGQPLLEGGGSGGSSLAWTCRDCGRGFAAEQGACLYCGGVVEVSSTS